MIIDRIEVGDIVSVHFNTAQCTLCHEAVVLHMPFATGDSWIFKQIRNARGDYEETIHYVSEGCTITLIRKSHD